MLQKLSELILVVDIRARGNKMTSSQIFIKIRIISSIKLVDRHLPDRMRSTRTVLSISMALVWQSDEKCIKSKKDDFLKHT